ncbi:ATPase, T2SS/T4P/T4SS family [Haloglomus litoreum]|uniref:ATPase, T2SS/T4P/T4SS family n=1 Tax=Haloglomus litoreum TaxID=3034026 RepID=UPI0023E8E771|nr:ATPase, T2SS/T4P/T4SS family [Haloglomus sp. DT116]
MLDDLASLLGDDGPEELDGCGCDPELAGGSGPRRTGTGGEVLRVDASNCPGEGRLEDDPDCRATAVDAVAGGDVRAIRTQAEGIARWYEGRGVALLVAAGRFAETVRTRDPALANRARRDPLEVAAEAAGRSGPVSRAAAESGLLAVAEDAPDTLLEPLVGPSITRSLATRAPPEAGVLADRYELDTGAVVRLYDQPGTDVPRRYHVEPPALRFSADTLAVLSAARELLEAEAEGPTAAVETALDRATESGATGAPQVETGTATLATALEKHTRATGILVDLFSDPAVSDVFATAPVVETPLRVRRDDETMTTNLRLTRAGAAVLAGRFRRESGRAFARASPTLAATMTIAGRRIRVSGVTGPVSDGHAFALRAHDREAWRLRDLVANGTVPPPVAGLLSLAVERGVACLVTGERGAGKTTLLGALLWELPATARTVVVEDTPELPTAALREAGRDVQTLRVGEGGEAGSEVTAAEALRTALRLGESALVVGEIRGEEAAVLYEAMRVGAGGAAVLGTVHGDGAATVRERMVSDLGVPESSFADTDLLVTVGARETAGNRERQVRRVEEVRRTDDGAAFEPLYESVDGSLTATERLESGTSTLVEGLRTPAESYRETLAAATERGETLAEDSAANPPSSPTEGRQ